MRQAFHSPQGGPSPTGAAVQPVESSHGTHRWPPTPCPPPPTWVLLPHRAKSGCCRPARDTLGIFSFSSVHSPLLPADGGRASDRASRVVVLPRCSQKTKPESRIGTALGPLSCVRTVHTTQPRKKSRAKGVLDCSAIRWLMSATVRVEAAAKRRGRRACHLATTSSR